VSSGCPSIDSAGCRGTLQSRVVGPSFVLLKKLKGSEFSGDRFQIIAVDAWSWQSRSAAREFVGKSSVSDDGIEDDLRNRLRSIAASDVIALHYRTNVISVCEAHPLAPDVLRLRLGRLMRKIMKIRLAIVVAALAFACSLSSNVYALTITDPGVLGTVETGVPFGDASAAGYINTLLSQPLNSATTILGQTYTRNGAADPGSGSVSLPATSGEFGNNCSDPNAPSCTNVVPTGYEYVIAKYDGPNAGTVVIYLGGLGYTLDTDSSNLWLNHQENGYGLSGWKAFNGVSVPDGGSTVTLLGSILLGLGMLRRRFSKN
jgi:hypothetical protein